MAEETITILKVGTEEAVQSVNDLRENVKVLKAALGDLTIGTDEYKDTLDQLKVNQNALKDAMYASTASMGDLTAAATGTSETYNGLVHRMAALKEELRATDISTESGKKRFGELATEIKNVNDKLKDLDAQQGNYQRNVGDYSNAIKGAFKDMSDGVDAFGKGLKITQGGVEGFKTGLEGISKSPALATFGILVTIVAKLAEKIKENDTASQAFKKALDAVKPVLNFVSGIVEKLAEFLADIIGKVTQFIGSNGILNKVIKGLTGVGNAIVRFVIAPFEGVVDAIKVLREKGVKGLGEAAKALAADVKSGVSFKQNFAAGQKIADNIIAGAKSKKKDIVTETTAIGREAGASVADAMMEAIREGLANDADAAAAAAEMEAMAHAMMQPITDEQERQLAERKALEQDYADFIAERDAEAAANAQKAAEQRKATLQGVASATASILSSIADLYEADTKNSEKNAKKVKALRIASATIETINGAIGAYMQAAASVPPPAGIILGAAQAATITASGLANIAKIRATDVSTSGTTSTASTTPAVTSAPSVTTPVNNVRNITSASEEDRLNEMAKEQRVYILASDIQASQNQIKTQVTESSF